MRIFNSLKLIGLIFMLGLWTVIATANEVRYGYDAAGQLIRAVMPDDGDGIRYLYDEAGNLLAVEVALPVEPPTTPDHSDYRIRCQEEQDIWLPGEHLHAVALSNEQVEILQQTFTADGIQLRLKAHCAQPLEGVLIRVRTLEGVVEIPLTVQSRLPRLTIGPVPVALDPGAAADVYVTLSHLEGRQYPLSLTIEDPSIAEILNPVELLSSTENTEVFRVARIRALQGTGITSLAVTIDGVGRINVPVLVMEQAARSTAVTSAPVGVMRTTSQFDDVALSIRLQQLVGVYLGRVIHDLSPRTVALDQENVVVDIKGVGLNSAASVRVIPDDGVVVLGTEFVDDGVMRVSLSVAADAPLGFRQIEVWDEQGPIAAGSAMADRLLVSHNEPVVQSIYPNEIEVGELAVPILIRGLHLDDVHSIEVVPSDGVYVRDVSAHEDGNAVTVGIGARAGATVGPREIIVRTPVAEAEPVQSHSNILYLVDQLEDWPVSLVSEPLSVFVQSERQADVHDHSIAAPSLGVAVGRHISGIEPSYLVVGQEQEVTLLGGGFHDGLQLAILPESGITVLEPPMLSDDGRSATVMLHVDHGVDLGLRQVELVGGLGQVFAPSHPLADRLRVVPADIQVDSTATQVVNAGEVSVIELKGQYLDFVDAIQIESDSGLQVGAVRVRPGSEGEVLDITLWVPESAAPGDYVVNVLAPYGVVAEVLVKVTSSGFSSWLIHSTALGVQVRAQEAERKVMLTAPSIGVERLPLQREQSSDYDLVSNAVGLLKGPAVTSIKPRGAALATGATLEISGHGLSQVTDVQVLDEGVEVQSWQFDATNGLLSADVFITATTPIGPKQVLLLEGERPIPVVGGESSLFYVHDSTPELRGVSPAWVGRGNRGILTIDGRFLRGVERVSIEPAVGVELGDRVYGCTGDEQLQISFNVLDDAEAGEYQLRVHVPGASSEMLVLRVEAGVNSEIQEAPCL